MVRLVLKSLLVAGMVMVGASPADAADRLTLQLKWVAQAQFAGYFVAHDKGFYDDEGLDVTIRPGGPDISPAQVIAGGGADVIVNWMPEALAVREKDVPLVNIAQIFTRSGLQLVCRRDTGIASPADFGGKTIGVWFFGNEYPFLAWMSRLGLSTSGADADVTVLKQLFNVDPLLQRQADCISTMTYNEYWQIIDAGIPASELIVFSYEDQGVAMLEDGLYVLASSLEDPAMVDKLVRFVRASIRGWQYAVDNIDEAVEIVLDNDTTGAQTQEHQTRMLGEIAKLIGDGGPRGVGDLDPAAYDRTVEVLLSGASDPVITERPADAWTHEVWQAAVGR